MSRRQIRYGPHHLPPRGSREPQSIAQFQSLADAPLPAPRSSLADLDTVRTELIALRLRAVRHRLTAGAPDLEQLFDAVHHVNRLYARDYIRAGGRLTEAEVEMYVYRFRGYEETIRARVDQLAAWYQVVPWLSFAGLLVNEEGGRR